MSRLGCSVLAGAFRTRYLRRVAPVLLVCALASAGVDAASMTGAHAAPIGDLQAQAEQLAAQIDQTAERAAMLSEQIKYAEDQLEVANAAAADAQERIAAAKQETARLVGIVHEHAAVAYRNSTNAAAVNVFTVDPEESARLDH